MHGIPRFRHRRIARPREGGSHRFPFFPDQRLRRKAAEKLPAGSLRSKSDFKLLTLIKVGPLKVSSLRAPGPQLVVTLCREIMHGIPRFRHRRIARPREGEVHRWHSRSDQRWRRKEASKVKKAQPPRYPSNLL